MDVIEDAPRTGFLAEITDELRTTLFGRSGAIGGILPPIAFLTLRPFVGIAWAAAGSLIVAAITIGWRLSRGNTIRFAVAGAAGALIAAGFALRQDTAEAYFLPGIIQGAATTVALLVSILLRRPLVAFTSWITRGWPADWYRHAQVQPAYMLTTWLWVGFFALRTLWQWQLYLVGDEGGLLLTRIFGGWPATVALLVATYVLGRWRLTRLKGPSVDEYLTDAPQPWVGQRKGF
ncbi:MAG: DUF3159 domain-containing protein [Acidimicrobiia bacterium]|nr:DUF3159 domain-containing protein [Acidimicrobiia bacterium]